MKLYYRKFGEGPPLIILHGLYGSSDNWVSIAKIISDTFTVILPDMRNHGASPHSDIHDYPSMSRDVYELADALNLKRFFLAGHSMGGKCAAAFAIQWPEMLNGLLIADISPFSAADKAGDEYRRHLSILNAICHTSLSGLTSRNEVSELMASKIGSAGLTGFILKNLMRNDDGSFGWKLNAEVLLSSLDIISGSAAESQLPEAITGFPVIFIRGEKSAYLPAGDEPAIKRIFPAAEFVTIPGAGHWIHADAPANVALHLKRLLTEAG